MTALLRSDAAQAYEELKPLVDQLIRRTFEAPLDTKERSGLSLLVTSAVIGATCRFVQETDSQLSNLPLPEMIRAVGNLLAGMVEQDGHLKQ